VSAVDVLVVGGGAFGTTLAHSLAGAGRRVLLWVRREDQARAINETRENPGHLAGVTLAEGLEATTDLAAAVPRAPVALLVVPSRWFRPVAREIGDHLRGDQILIHATKGIELATFKRMSQILKEETCALKVGVLSGPNLAREIAAGKPAGALVASRYDEVVRRVQALFEGTRLRLYGGHDVIGAEIGGAFKNIIALAAGVVDGMAQGDNTKALLITRGLSEMARFGVALGADVFTFGGLAGIGDLMATCASPLSRNHQVGVRLAAGERLEAIEASMSSVAEGVPTTRAVHEQATARGLDLHIVRAVHALLYEGLRPDEAIHELMRLPAGLEMATLRFE
jgi:glycerol-3-phosphate dehydrogenase (NAD(P)+)